MAQPQNNLVRVSVSEAAKLFGVSPRTIRRAIKNQEITYIVVHGRYKLNFESIVNWSQQRATTKNKLASMGIGQYVDAWRINNKLYSPHAPSAKTEEEETVEDVSPPDPITA